MAPPPTEVATSNCSSLLIYPPRKDERLSWPSCLIFFTHIVVTRQLKVERRTGSVRRPKTGVPPTVLRNQRCVFQQSTWYSARTTRFWLKFALEEVHRISKQVKRRITRVQELKSMHLNAICSHFLPYLPNICRKWF